MAPCAMESVAVDKASEKTRTLYITRHGESENNLYGKIGGNAALSCRGEQYALALARYVKALSQPCTQVWTSTLVRTQQTAAHIPALKTVKPELDEIDAGQHDNLTYEEIAQRFPVEFALRDKDKLNYRYPKGESYVDVVKRLSLLLPSLEQQDNLLIVSHQATIRCLLTLLLGYPLSDLPYLKIPLHTVIKLTVSDGEVEVEYHRLPVDCVDTYRPKPANCSPERNFVEACQTVPAHL